MEGLKIVFMGTPEFAVPSLEILMKNNFNIVAVVTAPDKPKGRGQVIGISPIKECAIKYNIPVLQPTNLKAEGFIDELKSFNADLQIVVAFRMLPEIVWSMPPLGSFNLHGSLLPNYRGAAPINWAIINGEIETGVSTFFLKHAIDTGSLIFQEKEVITDQDDAGTLYQRLMVKGAYLVLKTAQAIAQGTYTLVPQDEAVEVKHAPKIIKETCEVNWAQSSEQIRNFVRGLSPYPSAWAIFHGKHFKIHKVSIAKQASYDELEAGHLKTDNKTYLWIKANDGWLSVDEFQPEGKKKMKPDEFFRGNKL
jgi:methionyl-tRNA formyltransferase